MVIVKFFLSLLVLSTQVVRRLVRLSDLLSSNKLQSNVQFGTKHGGKSNTFLWLTQIFYKKNALLVLLCAQNARNVQVF